ncbi:MAG TPA: hypothetical protein VH255_07620 [Verrucomicrobiae bacterium]|jgi:flagellar biosynthesis protein FlhF|nr:hypothetical protein [Verrucomicrobiae bacterium]
MKPVPFIAENADAALKQIHEQLGETAVVLSVRKLPSNGLSRLLHRPGQIEVMACVPEEQPARKVHDVPQGQDAYSPFGDIGELEAPLMIRAPRAWRSISWLESLGLLPQLADRLEEKVRTLHGEDPPLMPITEWAFVRKALAGFWHAPPEIERGRGRPHVFIGPPGSGKTTLLCKWLTKSILSEDASAHVWRLDGASANMAEFLTLHCEMLNVPLERFWTPTTQLEDFLFIDLPGTEAHDPQALTALREQLATLPQPHIHLVLNAAYDTTILFEQFNAFAAFKPEDLIFTHLDEERHRVKLWNFVLGTNCALSFLSGGQKIPGEFHRANSLLLFPSDKCR